MLLQSKYLITVFDEKEESLVWITEFLEDCGYEVAVATNIDQLKFCLQDSLPDIFVMRLDEDIENKREVLFKWKKAKHLKGIPVMGILEQMTNKEIDEYYQMGIDSICSFPFSKGDVRYHLEQLIKIKAWEECFQKKSFEVEQMHLENERLRIELEKRNQEVEQMAEVLSKAEIVDPIVGIYTRNYALENIKYAISRFNRKQIISSVALCDIDDFSRINLVYGHQIGDQLLRELSDLLMKNKREADIVARYGQNQFIIVLPDTEFNGLKVYAERIHNLTKQTVFCKMIHISLSFGCASYDHVMPVNMFIKMAEDALKLAKNLGKSRIVFANEELRLR